MILAAFDTPCQIRDLKSTSLSAGFKWPKSLNASALLSATCGLAIRTPEGWEITASGKSHLAEFGVEIKSSNQTKIASDLRSHADRIQNEHVKVFLEEAIVCYERKLFRAAVVMSWGGAVAVLQQEVVKNHLNHFNSEAHRVNHRWKFAVSSDDLGLMKERTFLDTLQNISMLGKNVKSDLIQCLDRRNSCGHPNSYKLADSIVAAHLETLILNVFARF